MKLQQQFQITMFTIFVAMAVIGPPFCRTARILGFFSYPSYSHQVVFQVLARQLSLRGHNVTVFTPNPQNNRSLVNLTEIDLRSSYEFIGRMTYVLGMDISIDEIHEMMRHTMHNLFRYQMNLTQVQEFFRTHQNEHFDVVITEVFLPVHLVMGGFVRAPIIATASMDTMGHIHRAVGNPDHPLLNPNVQVKYVPGSMNLFLRAHTTFYALWYWYWYYMYVVPETNQLFREYVRTKPMPTVDEIEKNISMVFINVDPVLNGVRANIPAVIQMGLVHIEPVKPLPEFLANYLDHSPNGVILFSLGSNVQSAFLDKHLTNIFYQALSTVPFNVIWKWESNEFPYANATNILPVEWLPQRDVLAHKNLRVFVSQCGQQSMEEAVISAVPIVGVPFFADQVKNVQRLVHFGSALQLYIDNITVAYMRRVIIEVATNPRYRIRANKLQRIVQDQPQTGLERAIWWTEYVIRHKGASHLKPLQYPDYLPLYQYLLLDVMVIFGGIILLIACVVDMVVCSLSYYVYWRWVSGPREHAFRQQNGGPNVDVPRLWIYDQPLYAMRRCANIVMMVVGQFLWYAIYLLCYLYHNHSQTLQLSVILVFIFTGLVVVPTIGLP